MHHPILFLLGALFLVRLFVRARWRRFGCGHARFHGPIVLGGLDDEGSGPPRWMRRHRRHRRHWRRFAEPPAPQDVAAALELNPRQNELFSEVLARAQAQLPPSVLPELLSTMAREPFARPAVEFIVGPGELADDVEQLHHSLTPEQRAKLQQVAVA